MSSNEHDEDESDRVEDVSGTYLPNKGVTNSSLRLILESNFLDRLRFRADRRTFDAMRDLLSSFTDVKDVSAEVHAATERELSAIRRLQDAPLIHDLESQIRIQTLQTELRRVKNQEEKLKHKEYRAKKFREAERASIDAQHEDIMKNPKDIAADKSSQAEQEFRDRVNARIIGDDIKKKYYLSPEQEATIDRFVEFMEGLES